MKTTRFFLLFFACAYIFINLHLNNAVVIQQPETRALVGVITKIEKSDLSHVSFIFHAEKSNFYLNWYYPTEELQVGQSWHLLLHLKPPHGLHNPFGFDFEKWLRANHVSATGFVAKSQANRLLGEAKLSFIDRWRKNFGYFIQTNIHTATGLLLAIAVGDRELMQEQDWQVLQATGTNHLFAIAGLHMGVLAFLIYELFNFLFKYTPKIGLYFPRKNLCLFSSALVLIPYALLSGFALPAQRALFMILSIITLAILSRPIYIWHQFMIILLLVLCCDPWALDGISLYLSFFAIILIIAALHGELIKSSKWRRLAKIQAVLYIGLIPINFWFFGNSSLVSPLANMVTIPWMTFLVVPSCLLASLIFFISKPLALLILKFAALMLNYAWKFLVYCADLPISQWHYLFFNNELMCVMTLLLLLFILVPLNSWRVLGTSAILAMFFYRPSEPKYGEIWLTVFDVGQGLATLVQTQHHVLIYDAGLPVAADYLQHLQHSSVDLMVISHGDMDHRAGAGELLKRLKIQKILTSAPQFFPAQITQNCRAGESWSWDGVQFDILAPSAEQGPADNDASCVLRVSNGHTAVLLPGDIEAGQEQWLLQNARNQLPASLIVAPHHGSSSSSTWPFLLAIQPKVVIFSTGFYNRYHFPAISVVKRYTDLGAIWYNTALNGAVSVQLDRVGKMDIKAMSVP